MDYSTPAAWVAVGLSITVIGIANLSRTDVLGILFVIVGLYVATHSLFTGLETTIRRGRLYAPDGENDSASSDATDATQ